MKDLIQIFTIFILTFAGMTSLCLAMDQYFKKIWLNNLTKKKRYLLKVSGWFLTIVAIVPCISYWGNAIGIVAWVGFLSASALTLVLSLAYIPKLSNYMALIAFCFVMISLCIGLLK